MEGRATERLCSYRTERDSSLFVWWLPRTKRHLEERSRWVHWYNFKQNQQVQTYLQITSQWNLSTGVEPRNFSYIHYNFRNHHLVNGSLLIRELEEADQGYYLCEAHNGIGAGISKLVFLTVHVPPHFDTKHRSYNVPKVRLPYAYIVDINCILLYDSLTAPKIINKLIEKQTKR